MSCATPAGKTRAQPQGIDKGVGVARALEYLGRTDNARTFGFGDSGNDLGMLAAVETAVAMGNAMPEVKAVADYVTTTSHTTARLRRCATSAI
ncbi:MAG: HAD family hydrolase [Collinsella sp.]